MASSLSRRPSWRSVTPVLAVAAFGLVACTSSQESSDVEGADPPVFTSSPAPAGAEGGGDDAEGSDGSGNEVQLKDPTGNAIGSAKIAEEGGHVRITVKAHGLEPGFHGLHFHQIGKCEPNSTAPTGGEPGDFKSAGGHLQVGDSNSHPASGDLTSLQVRTDGNAELVTTTDSVTVQDLQGKALMVHSDEDNFGNIPERYHGGAGPDEETMSTGDAGGRVACGVVE